MVNNLYVVTPRGFCAGVEMAIKALTWMLKIYDETIYCYHEIVHNDWIVKKFKENNVKFVNHPDELPDNSTACHPKHVLHLATQLFDSNLLFDMINLLLIPLLQLFPEDFES